MKTIQIIAIFLFLLYDISAANDKIFDVQIDIEKDIYVSYEPIWFDVSLTNVSTDNVKTFHIFTPNHLGFEIYLINSSGQKIEYTGAIHDFGPYRDSLKLVPNQTEYKTFDILRLYNDDKSKRTLKAPSGYFNYLPPDKYTFQIEIAGVESNKVSFKIDEPSGVNLEALKILHEADKFPMFGKDSQFSHQLLQELFNLYPNNVYNEMSYFLFRLSAPESYDLYFKSDLFGLISEEMLDKFPNSGDTESSLKGLIDDLDIDSSKVVLNNFIKNNPNTRISKYSQQILRKRILKK